MMHIRPAEKSDAVRMAEIKIFNYRLNFYPVFRDDEYYFSMLQVPSVAQEMEEDLQEMYVFDDGAVKGFVRIRQDEIVHLFVEPVLQGNGIGAELLRFAVEEKGGAWLWALEKNERAIRFYQRHGFRLTDEKELEEDTEEYLVKMRL